MAATPSYMVPLGTPAPDFSLPDPASGRMVSLADVRAGKRGVLVMFLCNHCPYVKHVREAVAAIGREYGPRGIGIVAISANDATQYPDDGPAQMAAEALDAGYTFPYVYDESQEVAMAFQAACTPDFFVYDADERLVYRGQLDDSRPARPSNPGNPAANIPVTGADLRAALDALLEGGLPLARQIPSIGCNIKWRAGNGPA
jgi:thiol-disulfide isomerase/thioredoxin